MEETVRCVDGGDEESVTVAWGWFEGINVQVRCDTAVSMVLVSLEAVAIEGENNTVHQ